MPVRNTFDIVRKLGLVLPNVEEGTTYGTPALKVRGRLLACMTSHKSAEPNSLAVCVGFEQRDELIAAEPDTYYVKPHYVDYPVVLVRLSRIRRFVSAVQRCATSSPARLMTASRPASASAGAGSATGSHSTPRSAERDSRV